MKVKPYRFSDGAQAEIGYEFWCVACKRRHRICTQIKKGVRRQGHPVKQQWLVIGDLDEPTFSPALRVMSRAGTWREGQWQVGPERLLCHLWVKQGYLEYQEDCPHRYAGKRMAMIDMPLSREATLRLMHLP